MTSRTPPPTPTAAPAQSPRPNNHSTTEQPDEEPERTLVSTANIQGWMTHIDQYLNEICNITADGKLNTDSRLKVNNYCRQVSKLSSQMAVHYQAVKYKLIQANATNKTFEEHKDLSKQLQSLKMSVEESSKPSSTVSFADMVKKGSEKFIKPTHISSVAIYPKDKATSSDDTKSLVQKIICPEKMNLHVRGLRKTRNGGVIISTDSKEDAEKIKKAEQLVHSGLTIEEPHKRKPRVVIIGVPSTMSEKDVLTCIYHQNLADTLEDSVEKFQSSVRLSHKSGK